MSTMTTETNGEREALAEPMRRQIAAFANSCVYGSDDERITAGKKLEAAIAAAFASRPAEPQPVEPINEWADLWYFVMDEAPREFEKIVAEHLPSCWLLEAHKLMRSRHPRRDRPVAAASPQPGAETEAVAWRWIPSKIWGEYVLSESKALAEEALSFGLAVEPLYTHPPAPAAPRPGAETEALVRLDSGAWVPLNADPTVPAVAQGLSDDERKAIREALQYALDAANGEVQEGGLLSHRLARAHRKVANVQAAWAALEAFVHRQKVASAAAGSPR